MVCNIINGSRGLDIDSDGDSKFSNIINSAILHACENRLKIQHEVVRAITPVFHASDLQSTFARRACKYLFVEELPVQMPNWSNVMQLSSMMGPQVACSVFKTLIGGWISNRRIQSPMRHCIFCNSAADALQHFVECDALWLYISKIFRPFLPSFSPCLLLGLDPPDPQQLYGLHLAYICYHALRHQTNVSFDEFSMQANAIIRSCPIAKHLILAHLGKVSLKYSLSPSAPPLPPAASQITTDFGALPSSPVYPAETPFQNEFVSNDDDINSCRFVNNLRLRMQHSRIAKLRASGFDVPSGPVFCASDCADSHV